MNLVELIQKVIEQVRPFLEARRLKLLTELDDDLGPFELDADKISAVLINLITNAIKFTPDGGTIELVARPAPDQNVEILVQDRGVGLDPRGAQACVSAVLHPARSQPPFLRRLRLQQAGARPRLEHRQELRRDARRNDRGRMPRRRQVRGSPCACLGCSQAMTPKSTRGA